MNTNDHRGTPPEVIATRVAIARQDLEEALLVNLGSATPADLVALVVKLRSALSDMINLHMQAEDHS